MPLVGGRDSGKSASFFERLLDILFGSTFNREMELQFCINLWSLNFFLKCPLSLAFDTESIKIYFSSFQNVS